VTGCVRPGHRNCAADQLNQEDALRKIGEAGKKKRATASITWRAHHQPRLAHHRARGGEVIAACGVPKTAVELVKVLFRRAPSAGSRWASPLGEGLAHLNFLNHS
jgi:hypothetical protein